MNTYMDYFPTGLLVAVLLLAGPGTMLAQSGWIEHSPNPVMDVGSSESWDDGYVFLPCVVKDGDTLKMWYSGAGSDMASSKPEIGYAWSLNGGTSWTRHEGGPVLPRSAAAWDNGGTASGAVLIEDDSLRMWYYGYPSTGGGFPGPYPIGYATSKDGIVWNKMPSPVLQPGVAGEWDSQIFYPGNVLKDGDVYKMWYSGGTGVFVNWGQHTIKIGYATSSDGIHWTKYDDPTTSSAPYQFSDPVILNGSADSPDEWRAWSAWVLKEGEMYEMWYAGCSAGAQSNILYATSSDGIRWTKTASMAFSAKNWSPNNTISPCVIREGSLCGIWYSGFVTDVIPKIGYATWATTGVEELIVPEVFRLHQNYPNPFNPATEIRYILPLTSHISLAVYDLLGREVAELVNGEKPAGTHAISWDASGFPSGVYVCRLDAGRISLTRKLILVR